MRCSFLLRKAVRNGAEIIEALILKGDGRITPLALELRNLPQADREILLAGSLINFTPCPDRV